MPHSRWRWAPLGCYLALAAIAIAYAVVWAIVDPGNSELAGVPLIVLGLPWSFLFHNFNPQILPSDYFNAVLVCVLWIAVNATLIGAATSILSNRRNSPPPKSSS